MRGCLVLGLYTVPKKHRANCIFLKRNVQYSTLFGILNGGQLISSVSQRSNAPRINNVRDTAGTTCEPGRHVGAVWI
jgi:hypothetical protein